MLASTGREKIAHPLAVTRCRRFYGESATKEE